MGSDNKKRIVIISLSSLLLVAMVIGVTLSVTKKNGDVTTTNNNINASTKAVKAICAFTDYKETCEQSLVNTTSTDSKELIKVTFKVTEKNIGDVLKNSTLLQENTNDSRTKNAFKVCQEVLETAIEDLKRSSDKVQDLDASKLNHYVQDIKTWLSATITHQETCIDAFQNTTGNTGEKMKILLKTASELSSNGLAMISSLSKVLSSLNFGGSTSRRLLEEETEIPSFVDNHARKLMQATPATLTPDVVVAQDGSGQFKTIGEAINTVPLQSNKTFVIHVKAGVYNEYVIIPKKADNVVLLGDGPLATKISGNKSFAGGVETFHTATLVVSADSFMAKDIGIENTAGPQGHQAVALRVSGDKAIFYNVQIDGFQDTLYVHAYRQFYTNCTISGTIDFIFGDSLSVFQNCKMVVRKPMDNQACMVTAQGRKDIRSVGAIIMQKCDIVAEPEFLANIPAIQAYLGRPWKELSRTIIMQSSIGGFISPTGWSPWMGTFALDTCFYGEYQNHGNGSTLNQRVTWKGIQDITAEIAQSFTPSVMYNGDEWITKTRVPYTPGLF